jgi:hypothetical protein
VNVQIKTEINAEQEVNVVRDLKLGCRRGQSRGKDRLTNFSKLSNPSKRSDCDAFS